MSYTINSSFDSHMDDVEKRIVLSVYKNKERIISIGRKIWDNPESGFREYKTAALVERCFQELGIIPETGLAVTGVKGYLHNPQENKPTIAIVGELDALPFAEGPSHACGHNAQIAALMGAAMILQESQVMPHIDGNIVFIAAPSEEFVEVEYKNRLIQENVIQFGGGKQELLRLGVFDDVDLVLGFHSMVEDGLRLFNSSMNGFINKSIVFKGLAAHSAKEPEKGINALNAARLTLSAIDFFREDFNPSDAIRLHACLTETTGAINIITDLAKLEISIRGKRLDSLLEISDRVNRAVFAGTIATGCRAEVVTLPGYLPVIPAKDTGILEEILEIAARTVEPGYPVTFEREDVHLCHSTDYGDVSHILPLLQFYAGGFQGELHNRHLCVVDEYLAYVVPSIIFALLAYRLLKKDSLGLRNILTRYIPVFDRETYTEYMKSVSNSKTFEGMAECEK